MKKSLIITAAIAGLIFSNLVAEGVYIGQQTDTMPVLSPAQFYQAAATEVRIPDANLASAIRQALGKEAQEAITRKDMASLSKLICTGKNISDLSGLEYAVNLTKLELYGNRITDLSPLAGLTNLTELYIDDNLSLSDIRPLSGLTNLKILYMQRCPVSDLTPLTGLTKLLGLVASNCRISDISPLKNLTALGVLVVLGNNISDISALRNLYNLDFLDISNNNISDFQALVDNSGLSGRDLVFVGENPFGPRADGQLQQLVARGVSVRGFTPTTVTGLDSPSLSWPAIDVSAIKLNWTAVTGATGYEIQVSQNSSFDSYRFYTSSSNSYSVPITDTDFFIPGVTYYVRVRAVEGTQRTEWSSPKSFTRPTAFALPPPTLNNPNIDSFYANHANLNWTAVTGADSYEIQVSRYSSFYPYRSYTSSSNSYSVPITDTDFFIPGVTYYVRVRAVEGTQRTEWSSPKSFTLPTKDIQTLKEDIQTRFPPIKIVEIGRNFSEDELRFILHCLEKLPPDIPRLITQIQARRSDDRYIFDNPPSGWADPGGAIGLHADADSASYPCDFLFPHEIGHIVHFRSSSLSGADLNNFQDFHNRSSSSGLGDFASYYGRTNWREDFATIFEAYMFDSQAFISRAKQSPLLLEKLKIVIKAFHEGDMVYVYKYDPYAQNFTMARKVKLGADGLPVF